MAKITSSPLTFVDTTDSRKFEVHISSNLPQVQTYNQNTKTYSPDWSKTELNLQASIYLDSTDITENIKDSDVEWYKNTISTATKISNGKTLMINTNVLSAEPIITYICQAKYQNLTTGTRIDFTRIDSGINGSAGASAPAVQAQYSVDGSAWTATLNAASHKYVRYSYDGGKTWTTKIKMVGEDGTSVAIKGTATLVTAVSGTNYYTVTYGGSSIATATLGDSYLYNGDLYVCSELRDGADYFVNVGKIQGDKGISIKSTTVAYGVSDSSSTRPADTAWQSTIPTVAEGKYLWTRTIIDYTDDTIADTVTYTYAKQGAKGDSGSNGSSVTVSSIQYQASTSATTAPTGTWSNSVVTVAEGSYLWTKTTFSDGKVAYGVAKQGAKGSAGTPASLVDITPSALYFKSTTGKDGTFTPEFIYLYPRFQSATYSNWQYSTDGGITWVAASGANGVSIGTYNSVASTLRISRASTLYTDNITSISFRCNSTTSGIYDTVSIAKIYDVVDLQIGGRNMYLDTKNYGGSLPNTSIWNHGNSGILDGTYLDLNVVKITGQWGRRWQKIRLSNLRAGDVYTMSAWVKNPGGDDGGYPTKVAYYFDSTGATYTVLSSNFKNNMNVPADWTRISVTFRIDTITDNTQYCVFRFEPYTDDYANHSPHMCVCGLKFENGNKATDWSPAPEDIDANIATVNTTLTNSIADVKTTTNSIASRVSATETSITTINGNISSLTTKVSAAEQKITPTAIVSTVRQSTDYTNDLNKKVGNSEIISKINQTAESVTISASKIGLLGATNIPDLTADKIKGGTLTLGGSSATTQNGQLLVKNASNTDMLKLNKDGIVVKSGHLAVASDFANQTYNWSTNTWTTTTNTSQLDIGDDYIRMGVYSPSGYTNYMRLLDNGLHFQGIAQGIGSWGSFIGHDSYGDFVIQDTVRGYIVFKGPDDDTEIANISGSGLSVSGVYSNTIASAANVYINSNGQFYRSTSSSKEYKTNIQNIQSEDLKPERLYDLPVREFKYKEGYLAEEDRYINTFVPGFIAEEVAEVYPIACEYDGDKPENWNIRFIVPAMLKLIQDQHKEINALKAEINNMKKI